jgi:hypothetical protein
MLGFDGGFSKLLEQGKHAKLQWVQDQRQINGYNLNNIKHEACKHFRGGKRGII